MAVAGLRFTVTFPGIVLAMLACTWIPAVLAAPIQESFDVVSDTNRKAANSQKRIDQLSAQTRALLEEYRRLEDGTEYQAAYTRELEQLDRGQREQIVELQRQIEEAEITRRRIVPLMRSMADALEQFVVLDLPFHQEERLNGVLLLKRRLYQPDLSVANKFRMLLEAYQLEQVFGNNLESWRGRLPWEGEELSVEFLRVGRVALYFQSLDGSLSGYWNTAQDTWIALGSKYNRDVAKALRVAKNFVAPQLVQLPMLAPEDVQ
jgi:hypothetical protein